MGLIDFVKSAGARLLGRDEEKEVETKPAAEAKAVLDRRRASALEALVQRHGLEVEGLDISVDGDEATVRGTAPDQTTREKVVLAVGNNASIARVNDLMEVSAPEPEAVYHTVVSGDSLSKIAKKHYGNAMKYPVIFEANKPMLSDPDKIYPGQVLRIPPIAEEG